MTEWTTARWAQSTAILIAALLFLGVVGPFFYAQFDFVRSVGFCCADDSYFAVVARTLAETGTYGLPDSWQHVEPFDPRIGVGPALIVPEAVAIYFFGNDYRLPGLMVTLTLLSQLAASAWILKKHFGLYRSLIYFSLSIFTLSFITQNMRYFGINIGEGPLLGFIVLGILVLGTSRDKAIAVSLGGVCLALAVLTKPAAVFPVAGICAAWSIIRLWEARGKALLGIAYLAVAVAVPILLFEMVRLSTLGVAGYLANWQGIVIMGRSLRLESPNLWTAKRLLHESYHLDVWMISVAAVAIVLVVLSRGEKAASARRILAMMLAAVVLVAGHFIASGWASGRYLWLAGTLPAFIIALPLLVQGSIVQIALIVATVSIADGPQAFGQRTLTGILPHERGVLDERRKVLEFLRNRTDLPIYSQWWGTIFDIVYFLPTDRAWYISNFDKDVGARDAVYVLFERFIGREYESYQSLQTKCTRTMQELQKYEIYICHAGDSTGEPLSLNERPGIGSGS